MYPAPFSYHRATSLADAQQLLAANPGAKLLAGGHSLLPLMKLRFASPDTIVDIGRVPELSGITTTQDRLRIGAVTPHAMLAASPEVREHCVVIAETAARIGDPAVRNRGTIGGSLAHADPGADLPTVLVALDASIEIAGPGGVRVVPADGFFEGLMATGLREGELITAVLVPFLAAGTGAAYAKFAHPASRYAVIGAAARVSIANGACIGARIVVGGLVPCPTRLPSLEAALVGRTADPAAVHEAVGHISAELGVDVIGDIFASAEYRRGVAAVYVERAVSTALERAR